MSRTFVCLAASFDHPLKPGDDVSGMPEEATLASGGTEVIWTEDGPKRIRDRRIWMSLWPDEASARRYAESASRTIPLLSEAEDHVILVARPFRTHGEINWSPDGTAASLFDTKGERVPGAKVAVMTTLGLTGKPDGLDRFGAGVNQVRQAFADLPTMQLDINVLPDMPMLDGPTITVWNGEADVVRTAYRENPHKTAMTIKDVPAIARASFTRMSVLELSGHWKGRDYAG